MQSTLIVGAGPGGTGPLVWAAQNGRLDDWLADGVTILDRAPRMGGTIDRYVLNSDSLGGVYLEIFGTDAGRQVFASLLSHPVTHELEKTRRGFPPLPLVGQHMRNIGAVLAERVARSRQSRFYPLVNVRALHLRADGGIAADAIDAVGNNASFVARNAIMAIGGRQDRRAAFAAELLPGMRLGDERSEKIVFSDELFRRDGFERAIARLKQASRPRVAILGGSHSAFSAAWLLTRRAPEGMFGAGDIRMLLRRPPRIFYPHREAAEADGLTVTERDICPKTNGVNRLGGLRGDGREMWRGLSSRPQCEAEDRVAMIPLSPARMSGAALRSLLDDAALIVPAFGYRAAALPVFDADGNRLRLNADRGGDAVARDGRVLLEDQRTVANLFGIGLGTGYRPWGYMGGEASFDGQANSLWLYQNHIGEIVYRGVAPSDAEDTLHYLAVTG